MSHKIPSQHNRFDKDRFPRRTRKTTVMILRDIPRGSYSVFIRHRSRIEYDAKNPIAKKNHQLIYQQGDHYGTVGDMCNYLTHDELLELEQQGYIRIVRG